MKKLGFLLILFSINSFSTEKRNILYIATPILSPEKIRQKDAICYGVKHFPETPRSILEFDSHYQIDIKNPYNFKDQKYLKSIRDKRVCMIMTSHLPVEVNKKVLPCSQSKKCISYLTSDLNFNGIIISDELLGMTPVLSYQWDKIIGPYIPDLEKAQWNQEIWYLNAPPEVKYYLPNWEKWSKNRFKKRSKYLEGMIDKYFCPNEPCSSKTYDNIINDPSGAERIISSIKAGNHLSLVFYSPIGLKKSLKTVLSTIEKRALKDKELKESIIKAGNHIHDFMKRKGINPTTRPQSITEHLKMMLVIDARYASEKVLRISNEFNLSFLYGTPRKWQVKNKVHLIDSY